MAVKVVDASAIAALLFDEPEAATVAKALTDSRLVAPTLLTFELANVFVVKCRRRPELASALSQAFALRRLLVLEEVSVDPDAIVTTAQSTGLTAYDASYLCVARQLDAELVTLDRHLADAARTHRRRSARPARKRKT